MAMDFVAGCFGGCAGVLVGHPFDTIKVLLQTQDFKNPIYKNGLDCFRQVVKNDSVSGLFRGMSSPIAGVAVVNAIVFGVQANLQRRMPNPDSLTSHFISGSAAGIAQSFVCSPIELVKTRIQVQQTQQFKSPWHCLTHIYKTEGLRGIFRGFNITMLREGPGFGMYFLAYEFLTRTENNAPISTLHMLMAGGAAGSISWLGAYPIDVIKTRFQVDGMTGPKLYKNSFDCCVKTIQTNGISSLFRGLNLTVLRAFPVNAATWATVTWIIRLSEQNAKEDSYTKLSEAKVFLPDIAPAAFQLHMTVVPENTKLRTRSQYERLGASNSCKEEASWLTNVLNSISGSYVQF